jgi:hypothetical protein
VRPYASQAITVSPAEAAHAYETLGRRVKAAAEALGISPQTVRARLRAHYGSAEKVPRPPLRSSSAAIGRAFEHRVRDALVAQGWWCIRAAGSKGEADLVALQRQWTTPRWPDALLVSVKRGGVVPVDEWCALWDLAEATGALPIVAFMARGGGIEWRRIVGLKDGKRGKRQPWTDWAP